MTSSPDPAQAAQRHEAFLAGVLRALPDPLCVFDASRMAEVYANTPLMAVLGYAGAAAPSGLDACNRLLHPEDRLAPEALEFLRRELGRRGAFSHTLRLLHADGQWRTCRLRGALLDCDADGLARHCVIVLHDITRGQEATRRLQEQEQRFRLLAEHASDLICTTDTDLRLTYVSPAIAPLSGRPAADLAREGNALVFRGPALQRLEQALRDDLRQRLEAERQPGTRQQAYVRLLEAGYPHADGHEVPVEIKASLVRDGAGTIQGLLLLVRDISARRQRDADLRLAAKVFENSLEGILITGPAGDIVQVNKAFTAITGYAPHEALGRRPAFLASGQNPDCFGRTIRPGMDRRGTWQGELVNRRKNGEAFPAAISMTEVRSREGQLLGHITAFRDITESKQSEERIRRLAYFDALTGLPNRSLFQDRLDQELARAVRNPSALALLFLDLDGFKAVNDSLGHAMGDRLLHEVAQRLRDGVRAGDTVARMGGDEFTVILAQLPDAGTAARIAARIARQLMKALQQPFRLLEQEVFVSASIGIALYPQDGDARANLLRHADTAMYHAKAAGKNGYRFYAPDMNADALQRLELQNALHRALVQDQFELHFQPLINIRDRRVVGVEALLRWRHPERGLLAPGDFMAVAEECGLLVPVGEWVLGRACRQLADWQAQGLGIGRIAVNVSRRQFRAGNLVALVSRALAEAAIRPDQLELEFNETVLMDDLAHALPVLQALAALGVRLAIDDFGTGYASLGQLQDLPVHSLKIDRRFISGGGNACVTRAIVALARSFNLAVVAEGVETAGQSAFLLALGCQQGQGYLFGRPLDATATAALLHDQGRALH